MDTVDRATRSRIMSKVGQRDTRPEMLLRRALHRLGFRYRIHDRNLPGSPDLIFRRFRAVVFVHGCFWHAHGCRFSTIPATRREFWEEKFAANRARDQRDIGRLMDQGWRVLVVWECAFRGKPRPLPEEIAHLVGEWLVGTETRCEIGDPAKFSLFVLHKNRE